MVISQIVQKPWPHKGTRDLGTQLERLRLCQGGNKRELISSGMYGELPMGELNLSLPIGGSCLFKLNRSVA